MTPTGPKKQQQSLALKHWSVNRISIPNVFKVASVTLKWKPAMHDALEVKQDRELCNNAP